MLINGIRYHVEIYGTGDPLVLLHGFTGSSANWTDQVAVFPMDFRVVTIDLPGHGRSDSPLDPIHYTMESAAASLITIFDRLGLDRVSLLGYSMGGRLALYTALNYPQRVTCLILESASPGLRTAAEREARIAADEALAVQIEQGGIGSFVDNWSNLPLFASQSVELRQRLHAQRLNNNAVGLANSLRGMGTGVQPSLWDRLPELSIPTLLLCGEGDAKFTTINREMAALIPRVRLEIVASAGHTVHAEQPQRYNQLIIDFLKG